MPEIKSSLPNLISGKRSMAAPLLSLPPADVFADRIDNPVNADPIGLLGNFGL